MYVTLISTFYYTILPHTLCHQSYVYPNHFLNTTSISAIRATRTATAALQTFRVLHQHEVRHIIAQLNNQSRKSLHLLSLQLKIETTRGSTWQADYIPYCFVKTQPFQVFARECNNRHAVHASLLLAVSILQTIYIVHNSVPSVGNILLIPRKANASRHITSKVHMLMQQYRVFL
jgi:dynactin complex subunit